MTTRIITYTLAGCMALAASSASAEATYYLGANGGVVTGAWNSVTSTNLANATTTGTGDSGAGLQRGNGDLAALETNFNVTTDKTFTATDPLGEIALGMRFAPNMRAELAVSGFQMKESYSQLTANTDTAANADVTKDGAGAAIVRSAVTSETLNVSVRQKLKNYSAMLNAYYEFGGNDMFSPYVTLGIGAERSKLNSTATPSQYTYSNVASGADDATADTAKTNATFTARPAARSVSKTKTSFAYKVGFGVDAHLGEMAKVGLSYGWHGSSADGINGSDGVADTATANPSTAGIKRKGGTHVVMVKARFEF